MQTTFALAALAAVAYAAPQAVTGDISPSAPAPEGCSASYAGTFQITAVNSKVMKRDIYKRACGDPGSLVISLLNGQLHDANGRTGYIAANYQFQFDGPPQAGAIYTGGFSACNNGSLALGGSAVFYECQSGSFYNLYDRQWAPHCEPILIDLLPCSGSSGDPVGQKSDGQPTGTAIATVTQISDGQPQAPSGHPITQISDGQPQAPTGSGSPAPITQISDGQPQAPTGTGSPAPITQISDGQPQAPTGTGSPAPITQISDGQPQAPTGSGSPAPITQISDGQPQAPTGTGSPAPITQISDGQPQAPTGPGSFVTSVTASANGSFVPSNPGGPISPTTAVTSAGAGTSSPAAAPTANAGHTLAGSSSFGAVVVGIVAAAFL